MREILCVNSSQIIISNSLYLFLNYQLNSSFYFNTCLSLHWDFVLLRQVYFSPKPNYLLYGIRFFAFVRFFVGNYQCLCVMCTVNCVLVYCARDFIQSAIIYARFRFCTNKFSAMFAMHHWTQNDANVRISVAVITLLHIMKVKCWQIRNIEWLRIVCFSVRNVPKKNRMNLFFCFWHT